MCMKHTNVNHFENSLSLVETKGKQVIVMKEGWGLSMAVEHLLRMHEALGLPSLWKSCGSERELSYQRTSFCQC